jgi:hypothetical protein
MWVQIPPSALLMNNHRHFPAGFFLDAIILPARLNLASFVHESSHQVDNKKVVKENSLPEFSGCGKMEL